MPTTPTPSSESILAGLFSGTPTQFFPRKKIDGRETSLGKLSERLQAMWALIAELEVPFVEQVAKFDDIVTSYEADVKLFGDKLAADKISEYQKQIDLLLEEIDKLGMPYKSTLRFFDCLVQTDFYVQAKKEKKPVLGIREGFVVICRDHDARDDLRSPINDVAAIYNRLAKLTAQPITVRLFLAVPVEKERASDNASDEGGPSD